MTAPLKHGLPARALIYPELPSNQDWLKHCLLYWDELKYFKLASANYDSAVHTSFAEQLGLISPITIEIDQKIETDFIQGLDRDQLILNLQNLDMLMELANLLHDHIANFAKQPITAALIRRYPNAFMKAARFFDYLKTHTSEDHPYYARTSEDTSTLIGPAFILIAYFTSLISQYSTSMELDTLSAHERLSVLSQPAILGNKQHSIHEQDEMQVITNLELPFPCIDDMQGIDYESLAKFHKSSFEQRAAFRSLINSTFANIPQNVAPSRISEYFQDCSREMNLALKEYKAELKQFRVTALTSCLRIGSTSFIPSYLAPTLFHQPILAEILGGASLMISGVQCYYDHASRWRKFMADHPLHYLFMLKELE